MSYYSEVAIAIRSSEFSQLIEGIPENTAAIKELIDCAEVTKKDDGILLYWSCIKWYYDSVVKFKESLYTLDSDAFYKIEIGEEMSDIEYDGAYYDNPFNLAVSRFIYKETD